MKERAVIVGNGTAEEREMERELDETLDRIRRRQGLGDDPVRPDQDPRDHKHWDKERLIGHRLDHRFALMMERLGFRYFTPRELMLPAILAGTQLPTQGQWRHAKLKMAWTDKQLLESYDGKGGPERFASRFELILQREKERLARQRARRLGLVV